MTKQATGQVSIPRRRVLMAGSAGMLAPALGMAAEAGSNPPHPFGAGDSLVLSGCLADGNARPLAGLAFEVRAADAVLGTGRTDGAGRFVIDLTIPAHAGPLAIRAGDAASRTLTFARSATPGGNALAQLQRDSARLWRAAVGITLA